MKYIVLEVTTKGGLVREVPFVFPELLIHSEVAELLSDYIMKGLDKGRPLGPMRQTMVVGAGFLSSMDILAECHGKSDTLGVKSRGDQDSLLLKYFDYKHGIQ